MTSHASDKYTLVSAAKVFGSKSKDLQFDVPVFKERADNVPEIDPNYQFRAEYLVPVLWALVNNKNAWLSGHTGTGKSTLITQICARLNWPMIRVNFDSEISRMDLVGRDVLCKDASGATISKFVDGILPQALQLPCVLLCDEVDFIRPDVAYVFQRALEDDGLLISEDGGRVVKPHPLSRIIATGNTQGQGDDFGIYQGARAQSMAFLDRFTVWVRCGYLPPAQELALIKKLVPTADDWLLEQVMAYVAEHRTAFEQLKVAQPLSPRTIVTLTQLAVFHERDKKPLLSAAQSSILSKCNGSDRNTIGGILDRVAKHRPTPEEVAAEKAAAELKVAQQTLENAKKSAREAVEGIDEGEGDSTTVTMGVNPPPIGYAATLAGYGSMGGGASHLTALVDAMTAASAK